MAGKRKGRTMAERTFSDWHSFLSGEKVPVKLEPLATELVVLGEVREIVYYSDKGSPGEYKAYVHEFGSADRRDMPLLLFDRHNGALIVMGGKFKITARGIVG